MLQINCPHCGKRPESEFQNRGEVQHRPADPTSLDDAVWADFLYARANPRGVVQEHWWHVHGCRRFIAVMRDTASNRIVG
jgi:sarcosine oxidase, subunit delta